MIFVVCDGHVGLLVGSALEPRAGGMIAAVNLRVAVLAGASRQALAAGTTGQLADRCRLIGAEESAGMPDRQVMALLAKVGPCGDEELVVIGAMYGVAVGAVLAYRCVFPQERPAFFGVAGVSDGVGTFRFQQRFGGTAVRIVAVDAGHLAFGKRHMGSLVEFGALLLVARRAGLVDAALGE